MWAMVESTREVCLLLNEWGVRNPKIVWWNGEMKAAVRRKLLER